MTLISHLTLKKVSHNIAAVISESKALNIFIINLIESFFFSKNCLLSSVTENNISVIVSVSNSNLNVALKAVKEIINNVFL